MPKRFEKFSILPFQALTPRSRFMLAILPGLIILAMVPFYPPILYKTPAIFLYLPVIIGAWIGGVMAGTFSLVICVLYALLVFRPHLMNDPISDVPSLVRINIYLFTNIFYLYILDRLEKALKQSRNALAVRDEFISTASHELRTPLTSLTLQIDVAKIQFADDKNTELENFLKKITKQTARLDQLITGMIDVTLIDSKQFSLHPKTCELSAIVNEIVDYFKEKDIPINFQIHSTATGNWDPDRLRQVVHCLIQNAVKIANNKIISVEVGSENDHAFLTVTDNGAGLTKKQLGDLFKRYPLITSDYHQSGVGLGLYLSQRIVEMHGGRILVDSIPGEKTTFKVCLP